jgi:iron-sulfur cluster repair protein YtfE (RIC family)
MNEAVRIVDEIVAEHGLIREDFKTLARVAAQLGSDEVKAHGSGSHEGPREVLRGLQTQLDIIAETLEAHFTREEVALENALRLEEKSEVFQALVQLWQEHQSIREGLSSLRKSARDIRSDDVRVEVWEAEWQDLKDDVDSFSSKLSGHANRESMLLDELKAHLEAK